MSKSRPYTVNGKKYFFSFDEDISEKVDQALAKTNLPDEVEEL